MTAESQDKTNRMCDAALEHIQGVRDDMGFPEALRVYQAQVAAFGVLAGQEFHSTLIGLALVATLTEAVLQSLARNATS